MFIKNINFHIVILTIDFDGDIKLIIIITNGFDTIFEAVADQGPPGLTSAVNSQCDLPLKLR